MSSKSTPSRPTLRSIAAAAGVTPAAVSLALRGQRGVSPETRQRIEQIALELGYQPDPNLTKLMAHLRTGKTRTKATIAVLSVREQPAVWRSDPYMRRYHQGAVERAATLGYSLDEFWLADTDMTPKRMKHILQARGIEGVFVFPSQRWSQFADFDFSEFACATFGRWTECHKAMHRAGTNHYLDMLCVLDELHRAGYRRPGLVLEQDLDARTAHLYSAAFLWNQSTGRFDARIPPHFEPKISEAGFAGWFRQHEPDAVIALAPKPATYLEWFARLGRRVPEEVGFAALDLNVSDPLKASGIVQDSERVGAATIDLIANQLLHSERGLSSSPSVVMFEGRWEPGETVRSR